MKIDTKQIKRHLNQVEFPRALCASLCDRVDELESALIKLRDCTWVITSPDCMDDVRDIADKALKGES